MATIWELLNMPAPTKEPATKKVVNNKRSGNSALSTAKERKDDEYYTRLADIEKECMHFREQFRDKIIYMPCDNPKLSEFWHYFHVNFAAIGLKKIICSFFDGTDNTYSIEYYGGNDADLACGKVTPMGTGDFRNEANKQYFDEANIVVTNPPFSLFREFVARIQQFGKDFLIIGNMNAVTYKEFFPLLRDNKVRLGYPVIETSSGSYGGIYFRLSTKNGRIEELEERYSKSALFTPTESNQKCFRPNEFNHVFFKLNTARWFTTLDVQKPVYDFGKMPHYDPKLYPKYDNYDAIEVSKLKDIPGDYFECMGVPITFIEKYNPEQFKIIDSIAPVLDGVSLYRRLLIQRIDLPVDPNHA